MNAELNDNQDFEDLGPPDIGDVNDHTSKSTRNRSTKNIQHPIDSLDQILNIPLTGNDIVEWGLHRLVIDSIMKRIPRWLPKISTTEPIRNALRASGKSRDPVNIEIRPYFGADSNTVIGTSIINNGPGMSLTKMKEKLLKMNTSEHEIKRDGNFGMGVKLVSGHLHDQVIIRSWIRDCCYQVIYIDEHTRSGVLKQIHPETGKKEAIIPVPKPAGINTSSGTQVDLIGRMRYMPRKIADFNNTRLLRLNIEGARDDCTLTVFPTTNNFKERVRVIGLLPLLEQKCMHFGVVEGKFANYYYAIKPEREKKLTKSDFNEEQDTLEHNLFLACRDEVFKREKSGKLLSNWGITDGADRVVLVVELDLQYFTPNLTRTGIIEFEKDHRLLKKVCAEWQNNIPERLKEHFRESRTKSLLNEIRSNHQTVENLKVVSQLDTPATVRRVDSSKRASKNSTINIRPKKETIDGENSKKSNTEKGSAGGPKRKRSKGGGSAPDPTGKGPKRSVNIEVPFVDVEFRDDLGNEDIYYQFSKTSRKHTLMININCPQIKPLLEQAKETSSLAHQHTIDLIDFSLQTTINQFIIHNGKVPDSDQVRAILSDLMLPRMFLDPKLQDFLNKRKILQLRQKNKK